MSAKTYKLSIDPRILELLGPNLHTNIYYVLAEMIANAYDVIPYRSKSPKIRNFRIEFNASNSGTGILPVQEARTGGTPVPLTSGSRKRV